MADNNADELRKLADVLDEAKRDINLAREQCIKHKHLSIRASRSAVQAARAVAAAVDLGFAEIWPQGLLWVLSAMRNPDDPDRPPATIQAGEWKGEVLSMTLGSGCNPDGTLRDDTALQLWMWMCLFLRSATTIMKAGAGGFDLPSFKMDNQGRVLGRDGKPLPVVEKTDPRTGEPAGCELKGPAARATDDYDEVDALEHWRCKAADWVDACDVAADLIRKEAEATGDKTRRKQKTKTSAEKVEIKNQVAVESLWKEFNDLSEKPSPASCGAPEGTTTTRGSQSHAYYWAKKYRPDKLPPVIDSPDAWALIRERHRNRVKPRHKK